MSVGDYRWKLQTGNGDENCEAFLSHISLQYNVEVDVLIWDINFDGIISYKKLMC